MSQRAPSPLPPQADHSALPTPCRVSSVSLLGGCREIVIVHNGDDYRLRITRQDKLILTK